MGNEVKNPPSQTETKGVLELAERLAAQVDHCLLGYAIHRQNGQDIEGSMLQLRAICNEFQSAYDALPSREQRSREAAGFVTPSPKPQTTGTDEVAGLALAIFKDRMWRDGEIAAMRAALETVWPDPHMLYIAVAAVLEAEKELRSCKPTDWEGDCLYDEIEGLRRIFEARPSPKPQTVGHD